MSILNSAAINKLREVIRQNERDRYQYDSQPGYDSPTSYPYGARVLQPTIFTVLVTGSKDPTTGYYTGVVTEVERPNSAWQLGEETIKLKPANDDDILLVGRRYSARPSHADDTTGSDLGTDDVFAVPVYIAYADGGGEGDTIVVGTGTGTGEQNVTVINDFNLYLYNDADLTINSTTGIGGPQVNLNIPVNIMQGLMLRQVNLPDINADQDPLVLHVVVENEAPIFRMAINVPAQIKGLAPAAGTQPGRMLGIINAGPESATWQHQLATDSQYHVKTPGGNTYTQQPNELLMLYADGSAEEWIMVANTLGDSDGGEGTASSGTADGGWKPKEWYTGKKNYAGMPPNSVDAQSTTMQLPTSTAYFLPFMSSRGDELVDVFVRKTTDLSSGNIGFAVYSNLSDRNPKPGTLIADFGTIGVMSASTYTKNVSMMLERGVLYWFAFSIDSSLGADQWGAFTSQQVSSIAGWSNSSIRYAIAGFKNGASPGSFPATVPSATEVTVFDEPAVPAIGLTFSGAGGTAEFEGGGGAGGAVTIINTTSPIIGGPITSTGTISHANSGVAAGYYPNANIVVDLKGHVVFAEEGTGGGGGSPVTATNQFTHDFLFGGM